LIRLLPTGPGKHWKFLSVSHPGTADPPANNFPLYAGCYPTFEAGFVTMDQVNLKRLAKELGLAISTVSRALRDSHEISQETKDRVQALADKLGFQPNPHASSLRRNKSKTIAVIVPEIENNFFSQAINGIELIAQQKGYHVLIYLTHEDYQLEKGILQLLQNGRVDGIMISVSNTTTTADHLNASLQAGLPIVFFDRVFEEIDVPKVTTDDIEVSFKATEYLVKKGCKRIAFLSMAENLSISKRRHSGYQKAIEKYQPSGGWQKVVPCSPNDEQNRQMIDRLLQEPDRPDGIFAAVEKFAINTYQVCNERNISIPQQLKVIGFSNYAATALFNPPFSSIIQPAFEIGREATTILFKIIENKKLLPSEKKMVLPSQIVYRGSTS
jgi:LacI family transcriptional regulator